MRALQKRRYDVVFFDMGFTLVWSHPSDLDNVLRAYRDVGLELDREKLAEAREAVWDEYNRGAHARVFEASREYARKFWLDQERAILARLGVQVDEALIEAYYGRWLQIYQEPGRIRTFPEVHDVLSRLREKGYRLGIISNWGWDLPFRCEQVGIADYFECVVASARVGCDKPHPRIFQHALERVGASPRRAIHVGDLYEADVAGARKVGMDAVLIDRDGDADARDCPVIRDLWELLPLLESES